MSNEHQMRILIFEPYSKGHPETYYTNYLNRFVELFPNLVNIGLCVPKEFDANSLDDKISIYRLPVNINDTKRLIDFYASYMKNLSYALSLAKKENYKIFHHMYIDTFKIPTALVLLFKRKNLHLFITLHWADNKFSNNIMLNKIFKLIEHFFFLLTAKLTFSIFVHGEAIKSALIKKYGKTISNKFVVIPYPIAIDDRKSINQEKAREILNLPPNTPLLLAFGGTRYEKGIDILIDALEKISSKIKVAVIIAGEALYFDKHYFKTRLKNNSELRNRLILRLNYIKKEDTDLYFNSCNIVVLPYRKIFAGQSGPLTLALKYRKPLIASDVMQIGYDVNKYKIGITFKPEDVQSLSQAIKSFITKYDNYSVNFAKGIDEYLKEKTIDKLIITTFNEYKKRNYVRL